MGAQHVSGGVLHVKQDKTGVELALQVHLDLAAVIAATPSSHLTFLTTTIGGSFAVQTFAGWFRRECDKAGLPHCSARGFEKGRGLCCDQYMRFGLIGDDLKSNNQVL